MNNTMEKLKSKCKYCGKEFYSLYRTQLNYNVQAHELSCKKRIKAEPVTEAKTPGRSDDHNMGEKNG